MIKGQKIIAMIPARMGSTRLRMKNLALIDGRPMIYYAIRAAKTSGVFNRIVVNSESTVFRKLAERYGADFYQRPPEFAKSSTRSSDMVYDFRVKDRLLS